MVVVIGWGLELWGSLGWGMWLRVVIGWKSGLAGS